MYAITGTMEVWYYTRRADGRVVTVFQDGRAAIDIQPGADIHVRGIYADGRRAPVIHSFMEDV